MDIRRLAPFGVELLGFQIGSTGPGAAVSLRRLISENRVAIFRGQAADDADLTRFLAQLGELMFTAGETPVAGAPDLNIVSNIGRTTPPRSVFHTDTSYVPRPPAYTALRPVMVPDAGGPTLFSDQVRAAARLPAGAAAWLAGRTLVHGTVGPDGRRQEQRHPLLRRHPETGETALFLSTPERCSDLSGVNDTVSRRVVTLLYRHSIRPSNLYAHHWRAGDIVVWDDRVTMHRADHSAVVGDRVLHRGLVRGEVPVAA